MGNLEDTVRVEIKDLPSQEPPLTPKQRYGMLATGALVVLLVLYYATLVGQGSGPAGPPPLPGSETASGLKPGPSYDVVSGEPVDPATAPFRAEFYGTELYFNSRETFDKFRQDPLAYVKIKTRVDIKLNDGTSVPMPGGDLPVEPPVALPEPPPDQLAAPPHTEIPGQLEAPGGNWSEAREPPPPVEAPPAAPPEPVRPPASEGFGEDVILTEEQAPPSDPIEEAGDVILDSEIDTSLNQAHPGGPPGPAGPPSPLPR